LGKPRVVGQTILNSPVILNSRHSEVLEAGAKGIKAGKSLDPMKQEKLLDPLEQTCRAVYQCGAFIETLYNSLTGQKNGKFIKHN